MSMHAVEFKNIKYGYNKDNLLFDDLSFSIEQGEYIIILGNNGSGKSTLAKLITGIIKPISGDIYIKDKKVSEKDYVNNVSIVFQNPDNQFIATTVEEDIAFGLENKNIAREEMAKLVSEYARKVNMLDYLKSEPSKLSGGQKQRVAIAGALVLGNDILILDEATSMLDPQGKKEILDLINELRKQNPKLTVISITHHINEISFADRVMILKEGKVISFDKPSEVFKDIDNKELESFLPFELQLKKRLQKENIKVKSNNLQEICEELCR